MTFLRALVWSEMETLLPGIELGLLYSFLKTYPLCNTDINYTQDSEYITAWLSQQEIDIYLNLINKKNYKVWFGLVWFYSISTIVGYLMPNPFYTYILNIYDF